MSPWLHRHETTFYSLFTFNMFNKVQVPGLDTLVQAMQGWYLKLGAVSAGGPGDGFLLKSPRVKKSVLHSPAS